MIQLNSLLPLVAGFLSAMLATMSYVLPKKRSKAVRYFAMLTVSMSAWAFGAAFLALTSTQSQILQATPDELVFWLGNLQLVGGSTATSAWLYFTAAYTGRDEWLHGWRGWLVFAPLGITLLAGITNPWHGLLLGQPALDGSLVPGPLMIPLLLAALVFGPIGTTWMYRAIAANTAPRAKLRARLLVVVTAIPLVGAILWSLDPTSGGPMGVDPIPALFLPLTGLLAYEILMAGLGDILPSAERQFFLESSDAIIALDSNMVVAEVNPAALELLPDLEVGSRLKYVSEELEKHARFCFSHSFDDLTFESGVGGRSLWGRVRRVPDPDFDGCMLLLSDLTQLRTAQRELLERGRTPDGKPLNGSYLDLLGAGGDRD